jgi:hypothetical protein
MMTWFFLRICVLLHGSAGCTGNARITGTDPVASTGEASATCVLARDRGWSAWSDVDSTRSMGRGAEGGSGAAW